MPRDLFLPAFAVPVKKEKSTGACANTCGEPSKADNPFLGGLSPLRPYWPGLKSG